MADCKNRLDSFIVYWTVLQSIAQPQSKSIIDPNKKPQNSQKEADWKALLSRFDKKGVVGYIGEGQQKAKNGKQGFQEQASFHNQIERKHVLHIENT